VSEPETTAKRGGRKPDPLTGILAEVKAERKAQVEEWPERELPFLGGRMPEAAQSVYASRAANWRLINENRKEIGTLGWDGLFVESVWELLASDNEAERRARLILLSAVLVGEVESMDRRSE
jgi:hypothetical protein